MKHNRFSEHNWDNGTGSQPERTALFELLSAYFDGEATPEECRQVQMLLDTDPAVKRQYLHLHQIRQGLQAMPIPTTESSQWLGQRVLARLQRSRTKVISLWGSGAIAAVLIAGVVTHLPRPQQPNVADLPTETNSMPAVDPTTVVDEDALVVALNRPVLQIPKLATATPIETP